MEIEEEAADFLEYLADAKADAVECICTMFARFCGTLRLKKDPRESTERLTVRRRRTLVTTPG